MYGARKQRPTHLEIVAAGDFVKIGKKHYRHESGREIKYDPNKYVWNCPPKNDEVEVGFERLWVAADYVRRMATGEAA